MIGGIYGHYNSMVDEVSTDPRQVATEHAPESRLYPFLFQDNTRLIQENKKLKIENDFLKKNEIDL